MTQMHTDELGIESGELGIMKEPEVRSQKSEGRGRETRPSRRPVYSQLSTIYSLRRSSIQRAFTLIELMIVVGIILVLSAIAIPASTALIDRSKRTSTMATMKILETAIEAFEKDAPLRGSVGDPYYGNFPPDYFHWPTPSGMAESYTDTTPLNYRWDWYIPEVITYEEALPTDAEGYTRFHPFHIRQIFSDVSDINGLRRRGPVGGLITAVPADDEFRSIEALLLFIEKLSPSGNACLSGIQSSIRNTDLCNGSPCPDVITFGLQTSGSPQPAVAPTPENTFDLSEVVDAWGKPLRYQVRAMGPTTAPKFKWELRSAGPDGRFGPSTAEADTWGGMFSDPEKSDDVVLQGE